MRLSGHAAIDRAVRAWNGGAADIAAQEVLLLVRHTIRPGDTARTAPAGRLRHATRLEQRQKEVQTSRCLDDGLQCTTHSPIA